MKRIKTAPVIILISGGQSGRPLQLSGNGYGRGTRYMVSENVHPATNGPWVII
jgi:hypothetical protein